ncbi:phosphoribosylanthranilate isomerase [Aquaticitalea lipolytica]|nr:phosphoribosylanthranilate isomerase [Aquaticitalea lipolytica]
MKLKICGMKYQDNITEVASLQPDYLGFIFHHQSARHFEGTIPQISDTIKKVGVFVDESIDFIKEMFEEHNLDCVQLHGHESPEFCKQLKKLCHSEFISESDDEMLKQVQHDNNVNVIKVFSIKDTFDFSVLEPYEEVCDYFLFDTKGKLPGGNGYTFNWSVLEQYPSTKPYFLSGGIGLDQVENLKQFQESNASKYCYAIDINSKFEIEPGFKNIKLLKEFKQNLSFRT